MQYCSVLPIAGCLPALLFIASPAEGRDLRLDTTVMQDASASWRANGMDFQKNGHGDRRVPEHDESFALSG